MDDFLMLFFVNTLIMIINSKMMHIVYYNFNVSIYIIEIFDNVGTKHNIIIMNHCVFVFQACPKFWNINISSSRPQFIKMVIF